MYKVEKGIAIPKKDSRGRPSKYPFSIMEVGDSFEVNSAAKVAPAASVHGKKYGKKFIVKRHGDAYRCWRIA